MKYFAVIDHCMDDKDADVWRSLFKSIEAAQKAVTGHLLQMHEEECIDNYVEFEGPEWETIGDYSCCEPYEFAKYEIVEMLVCDD